MSFLSSIFGEKPEVIDYTPVNLSDEQLKALQGDINNWPQIESLGNLYQSYMLNAYDRAIPGFKDILKLGGTTTKDMLDVSDRYLHGEIPPDVAAAVQRTSAFQNLQSGGGGSFADANTARNYGLTSVELVSKGAALAGEAGNAAQRWAALSGAKLPDGMLVTPQQMAELDVQQNLIKRNVEQQRASVAAAPDPFAKAINDWIAQVGGTVVSSYLGGRGGDFRPKTSDYGAGNVTGAYGTQDFNNLWQGGSGSGGGGGGDFGGGGGGGDFGGPSAGSGWGSGNVWSSYTPSQQGFATGVGYPSVDPSQFYGGTAPAYVAPPYGTSYANSPSYAGINPYTLGYNPFG